MIYEFRLKTEFPCDTWYHTNYKPKTSNHLGKFKIKIIRINTYVLIY